LGFETHILTNSMEGESHLAAVDFINSAQNTLRGAPPGKRYAFLASGETTVTMNGVNGEGGRNQEFSLSAACHIAGKNGMVVASVATDGTDGPTDACGGMVDSGTISRACNAGLDSNQALSLHTSKKVLSATGDLLVSGPTGTNINDVALLLVEA
jgi:glycerate-2-kinase